MGIMNNKPHTVLRYERTETDGVIVETQVDEFVVYGNLQPITARTLRMFGDGFRESPGKKWTFYTGSSVELQVGGLDPEEGTDHEPDRIIGKQGRLIYIHGLKDWSDGVIPGKYWGGIESETESGGFADE